MTGIKEYFTALFIVCVICTVCDLLSDFASPGLSRALRLVCSLALLFTVFSCVLSGCKDISYSRISVNDFAKSEHESRELSERNFIESTRTELESNLSSAIYEKFGIKPDTVRIEFSTDKKDGVTEVSVSSAMIVFPNTTDEFTVSAADAFADTLFGTDVITKTNRRN